MNDEADYPRIYRRMHPKAMPYNMHERQMELSDLWPVDQDKFRRMINAARQETPHA